MGNAIDQLWSAAYLWVIGLTQSRVSSADDVRSAGLGLERTPDRVLDPSAAGVARAVNQIGRHAAITLILTLRVLRLRKQVFRQLALESQRPSFSQYSYTNLVQDRTSSGRFSRQAQPQPVAVLSVGIAELTTHSEHLSPEDLIGLLRFGAPEPRADDVVRASRCGAEILAEGERWTTECPAGGHAQIQVGVGLRYGGASVGNIADERPFEYDFLGDAVNVARRRAARTRSLTSPLVTPEALIEAPRQAGADPADLLPDQQPGEALQVRGWAEPSGFWHLIRPDVAREVKGA